jgi:tRNA1Val (adenine37-N6)-methyltransferase
VKEHLVMPGERVDDLQLGGLSIIQNPKGFCFGVDAVLLSDFAKVRTGALVVDLGTGNGILPLLLSAKSTARRIVAFEIQSEVAGMARRSVTFNDLDERIEIVTDDLKNANRYLDKSSVDVVVTNPPYVVQGGGLVNPADEKAIARHEIFCTLEDVIRTAAGLLKPGGAFYMVHRPSRLVDAIESMRAHRLEPKEIRFVHPRPGQPPNILLIKGVRSGGSELRIHAPLYVYQPDGSYDPEIIEIYQRVGVDPTPRAENKEEDCR